MGKQFYCSFCIMALFFHSFALRIALGDAVFTRLVICVSSGPIRIIWCFLAHAVQREGETKISQNLLDALRMKTGFEILTLLPRFLFSFYLNPCQFPHYFSSLVMHLKIFNFSSMYI